MTIARIGALLIAALLATSCTTTSTGEPKPATPNSSGDETSRPREITLDDLDPCALLPEADYDDFHLEGAGEPDVNEQGNKRCRWPSDIGFMAVSLVDNEGIEVMRKRPNPIERADAIEGFPTYTITLSRVDNSCFTAVDVADGQYLFAHAGLYRPDEGQSPCEYSHDLARSLMSTLVS